MDDNTLPAAALIVLRAIAKFTAVGTGTLAELPEINGMLASTLRGHIATLRSDGCVTVKGDNDISRAAREYAITAKGRRVLRRHAEVDVTRIAEPRRLDMHSTWDGACRCAPVRSGALDAFTLPSLRGDERVDHARPISLASTPPRGPAAR